MPWGVAAWVWWGCPPWPVVIGFGCGCGGVHWLSLCDGVLVVPLADVVGFLGWCAVAAFGVADAVCG